MEVFYKKTAVDELLKIVMNAHIKKKTIDNIVISESEFNEIKDDLYHPQKEECIPNISFYYTFLENILYTGILNIKFLPILKKEGEEPFEYMRVPFVVKQEN